jgi:acyl-coenzyme A thioesterase PaaI-like protein
MADEALDNHRGPKLEALEALPDPWHDQLVDETRGGEAFARLVRTARTVQDRLVGADLPPEMLDLVTDRLAELARIMDPYVGPEGASPAGWRPDLPGRGHPLLLPFVIDFQSATEVRGKVIFGRYYLGGGGAAHGGTLPLLFDDVMGRLANTAGRSRARTASITVNYRRITPIDVELRVESTVDREEGRKRFLSCRLYQGDQLVSDAAGLFVALRPGQP